MTPETPLHLFAGFGIELEYMIVQRRTLDVLPVADRVLHAVAGEYAGEVELGEMAWSNELALHVIELKTNGPAATLTGLPAAFAAQVEHINRLLDPLGGCLMPSAMHPWMDPRRDMQLWPHASNPIYEAFHRIFNCQGHGWSNLQSVHLNLPFADDGEFARLHAAIRLLLPLLPALAASSPMIEGRLSGVLDTRLEMYRSNAQRIPSVTGQVIPEPVFTRQAYEQHILQRLYRDIAPYDAAGILQYEWLNARGAIARFDRNAIEIRVLDMQECALADVAICAAIVAVLRSLVAERWCSLAEQQSWAVAPLYDLLLRCIRHADWAVIDNHAYLRMLGFSAAPSCTAGELWHALMERSDVLAAASPWGAPLRCILQHGPLARRLLRAVGPQPSHERTAAVYRHLCDCLVHGTLFTGDL